MRYFLLLRCCPGSLLLTAQDATVKETVAADATLTLVTHDRTLRIEHDGQDLAARRRTREVVVATRQCLYIPVTTSR